MNKPFRTLTILFLYVVTITSCRKDIENTGADGSQFFVSATSLGSYPREVLQALAIAKGYGNYVSQIKYDVSFYKVVYKTTYKGKPTDASGLVVVPKNMTTTPSLLSAQHGTMFLHSDAPSNFPATFSGFDLFASAGFVTVIPDYLGFGVSANIVHPYYDAQLAGTTVVDMLKAAKYYLEKENVSISSRLFLLGYSEGGYVTMAAQKEIETHPEHNLTITAAAAGAGGYDLMGMLTTIAYYPYLCRTIFSCFLLAILQYHLRLETSLHRFFPGTLCRKNTNTVKRH
jgi:dipeptidyl aminopeptidase/acylaminoacyl peptidase